MGSASVPLARVIPRGAKVWSRRIARTAAAVTGTLVVALASVGLFAWAAASGPALQTFVALVGAVSVSCTYLLWWHRRGSLWRKAAWTLILLVPASGHLYFLAAYRVRDDEL